MQATRPLLMCKPLGTARFYRTHRQMQPQRWPLKFRGSACEARRGSRTTPPLSRSQLVRTLPQIWGERLPPSLSHRSRPAPFLARHSAGDHKIPHTTDTASELLHFRQYQFEIPEPIHPGIISDSDSHAYFGRCFFEMTLQALVGQK